MRESGRFRPIIAVLSALVAVAALALGAATVAQAGGHSDNGNNGSAHDKVTLCHWVPAHGGSYIMITVNVRGANGNPNDEGHASHPNDIIPAPATGCPSTHTPVATPTQKVPTATVEAATETPMPTDTPVESSTSTPVVNTATPTGSATSVASTATPTGSATSVTNTATPTATNTPGGGGGGATATLPAATNTVTSAATNTPAGGAAAAVATPTGQVLGAAALPNTGSGGGGHTSWYLLGIAFAVLVAGGAASVIVFRSGRGQ